MLQVGIAGIGFMGMIHYLAYQKIKGVKVHAMCEKDRQTLAGDWRTIKGNFGPAGTQMDLSDIARYDDLDKLFADPNVDMVDICLPPGFHADAAVAALKAGKHVFCEKPIALLPADARRMVKAARAAPASCLMIGHVLPFFPEYAFAHKAVQSGKYGRLLGGHFKRIISDPLWIKDFSIPAGSAGRCSTCTFTTPISSACCAECPRPSSAAAACGAKSSSSSPRSISFPTQPCP